MYTDPFLEIDAVPDLLEAGFILAFILGVLLLGIRELLLAIRSRQEPPAGVEVMPERKEPGVQAQLPYELGRETARDRESWDRERRRRFVGRHQHRHCRRGRHRKTVGDAPGGRLGLVFC